MVAPRSVAMVAAIAGVVAAVAWTPGGGAGHRVFVVVPDAVGVIAGQPVRSAGRKIGDVESMRPLRGGRAARIALRIDDAAWPLTRGTTMQLRWGGTIAYTNRYIELRRGPSGAPSIADGQTFPA